MDAQRSKAQKPGFMAAALRVTWRVSSFGSACLIIACQDSAIEDVPTWRVASPGSHVDSTAVMAAFAPSAQTVPPGSLSLANPAAQPPSPAGSSAVPQTPPLATTYTGPNAPLVGLPTGEDQRTVLCERAAREGRSDRVIDTFCGAARPSIGSLTDLQRALGISFDEVVGLQFVLGGHSASLSVRGTSAINPRAIFMRGFGASDALAMAYTRGEQAAEIIARDRLSGELNFYFGVYEQPCNEDGPCKPQDVLTPATESGWTVFSVYPQQDFANTILDCDTCHLVQSPLGGSRRIMRFQELENPWTHWFRNNTPGGIALLADFTAAHGLDETYAGIPGSRIAASQPAALEQFVRLAGFGNQPNEFNTRRIELEVSGTSVGQPFENGTPGASPTWNALNARFLQGEVIPVPYHDVKVTDAAALAQMTDAYVQHRTSGAGAHLPDIREVFREDRMYEMGGMHIDPTLQGQALLTAACAQCHNSRLDQNITRARFNADLSKLSDLQGGVRTGAERDATLRLAIERLRLPETDIARMPPARLRELSGEQIQTLSVFLCSQLELRAGVDECETAAVQGQASGGR
jgi:hypothetical protein